MKGEEYRDALSYPPAVARIFERFDRIEPLLAHRNVNHHPLARLAPLLAPDHSLCDDGEAGSRHNPYGWSSRGRRRKAAGCQYTHSSLPPPHNAHSSLPQLQKSASDKNAKQASPESEDSGGPMPPAPPLMPKMAPRPPNVPSSAVKAAGVYSASIVPGMPRGGSRRRRPPPHMVLRRSSSPEADRPCWPEEGGKFPAYYNTNVIPGTWSTAFLRGLHKQFLESGTRAAAAAEVAEARQLKREEEQRRKEAERKKEAARREKLVDRLAADLQRTTLATYAKKHDSLKTLHENVPAPVSAAETAATQPAQNARFNMSPSVGTWFTMSPAHSRPSSRGAERTPAMVQDLAGIEKASRCVCGNVFKEDSSFCRKCGASRKQETQVQAVKICFKHVDPENCRTKVRSELAKALESGALEKGLQAMMEEDSKPSDSLKRADKLKRLVLDRLYIGALKYFVASQCACGNVFKEDSSFCRKCGAPRKKEDKFRQSTESWHTLDGLPLFEDYVASIKDESSVSGDWEHEVAAGDFIHHCFDQALDEAIAPEDRRESHVESHVESLAGLETPILVETPVPNDTDEASSLGAELISTIVRQTEAEVKIKALLDVGDSVCTNNESGDIDAEVVEVNKKTFADVRKNDEVRDTSPPKKTMEELSPSRERDRRELEELRAENARLRLQISAGHDRTSALAEVRRKACAMLQQAAGDGSLESSLNELGNKRAIPVKGLQEQQPLEAKADGERCSCGNVYRKDSLYCRKCGLKRGEVRRPTDEKRLKLEMDAIEIENQRKQIEEERRKTEEALRQQKAEVELARQRLYAEEDLKEQKKKAEAAVEHQRKLDEELEQKNMKASGDVEAARQRVMRAAEERRAAEEADLKREVVKAQSKRHLVECYWNGHLAADLVPAFKQQRNFEPLRAQTRDMVATAVMDGSLSEALKKIFVDDAATQSPTRQRRDPRKVELSARPNSLSPHEAKVPSPTPSPPLATQGNRRTPPSLVPFAEYYKTTHFTSSVCQDIAAALFPSKTTPAEVHPLRSPGAPPPQRQRPKGAAALLKGLKSGEVSKIVDKMEASEVAPQAKASIDDAPGMMHVPDAPQEEGREIDFDNFDPILAPLDAEDIAPPEDEQLAPVENFAVAEDDDDDDMLAPAEHEVSRIEPGSELSGNASPDSQANVDNFLRTTLGTSEVDKATTQR